jgi:hypothetical protein
LACTCNFFLFPAGEFYYSVAGVASLGVLHPSDVFSQVVSLFLESSFPWWDLFLYFEWFSFLFLILPPNILTVATVAT